MSLTVEYIQVLGGMQLKLYFGVLDVGESGFDILISGFSVERQQRYVTVLDFGFWNKEESEGE